MTDADSTLLDPTDEIAAAIFAEENLPLTGKTLKLTVTCDEETKRTVDQTALRKLIADSGARLHSLSFDLPARTSARAEVIDATMSPTEAVQAWALQEGLSSAETAELAAYTQRLLERIA